MPTERMNERKEKREDKKNAYTSWNHIQVESNNGIPILCMAGKGNEQLQRIRRRKQEEESTNTIVTFEMVLNASNA